MEPNDRSSHESSEPTSTEAPAGTSVSADRVEILSPPMTRWATRAGAALAIAVGATLLFQRLLGTLGSDVLRDTIAAALLLVGLVLLARSSRRVVLTGEGITVVGGRRRRERPWREVGQLSVSEDRDPAGRGAGWSERLGPLRLRTGRRRTGTTGIGVGPGARATRTGVLTVRSIDGDRLIRERVDGVAAAALGGALQAARDRGLVPDHVEMVARP